MAGMGEERNKHKRLTGKHKGIRSSVRDILMWRTNIKMDPEGISLEVVTWSGSG